MTTTFPILPYLVSPSFMPTTSQVDKPGAANERSGGVPTVHYFDFFSKGRGRVIRLLFIDAGIAYTDIRYTFDKFPSKIKPSFKNKGGLNPTGKVPFVELNGQIMTQYYAILRHFSRVRGNAYDGETEDEMFWVDRMCDITIDWRTKFVDAYFNEKQKEEYDAHCKNNRPNYMDALERLNSAELHSPQEQTHSDNDWDAAQRTSELLRRSLIIQRFGRPQKQVLGSRTTHCMQTSIVSLYLLGVRLDQIHASQRAILQPFLQVLGFFGQWFENWTGFHDHLLVRGQLREHARLRNQHQRADEGNKGKRPTLEVSTHEQEKYMEFDYRTGVNTQLLFKG